MNRSRPITFLASGAAILLIAVGVASCGGSNDNSSNSPAAAKQSQPPVVANSAPAPAAKPAPAPAAKPAKQKAPAPPPAPAPQASSSSNGIPQGDVGPGTATAGLLRGGDEDDLVGYLNATPRQGQETLENWGSFRPDHNRDEEDRSVHLIASSTGLPFRGGHGSCVIDDYTTSRATYREIACFASGAGSSAVVVAAAPTSSWHQQEATLRRAVSAFVP